MHMGRWDGVCLGRRRFGAAGMVCDWGGGDLEWQEWCVIGEEEIWSGRDGV